MHPLYCALRCRTSVYSWVSSVQDIGILTSLLAEGPRYTHESPRCRTSVYSRVSSLQDLGILMTLLAAGPRSNAVLLFPSEYLCGTILLTPYSMVWDEWVLRAGPMPFYRPKLLIVFLSTVFHFPAFFLCVCIVWLRFRSEGCQPLSPWLALSTF